jgi:hypothetical protein
MGFCTDLGRLIDTVYGAYEAFARRRCSVRTLAQLSPLAFANWLGLFITALNLARADELGTYCLPHNWPGYASVERSNASGCRRMVVGYVAMLILILILAPMPNSLWDSASDACPYL